MKIDVEFTTDPSGDSSLIVQKLFQVIFIEPKQSDSKIVVFTSAVISRVRGKLPWPALALQSRVTVPHGLSHDTIGPQPIFTNRAKELFQDDRELKIWWGHKSFLIYNNDDLENTFEKMDDAAKSPIFHEIEKETFRKMRQNAERAGIKSFFIQEPDSTKYILPFIMFPNAPEPSKNQDAVLFKTDSTYLSEELSKIQALPAVTACSVGYWIRQDFRLPKSSSQFSQIEFELRWPKSTPCRDFSLYFIINPINEVEGKRFRFIVDDGDEYILDILEKNPPQFHEHFREWRELGISRAKLLRFPSSKVDAHFRNGTARRLQIEFKLRERTEESRRQTALIVMNIWLACALIAGTAPSRQTSSRDLYPTVSLGNWFEATPAFWWVLATLSVAACVAWRYQKPFNQGSRLLFRLQILIFSLWSLAQLVLWPSEIWNGKRPLDAVLGATISAGLFGIIALGGIAGVGLLWSSMRDA